MTLKNLQEKGKKELEEVINNSYEILDTKGKGFEQVSEFLSKQTFIAYELGIKEMLQEQAYLEAIGFKKVVDSLKEKLTNNK